MDDVPRHPGLAPADEPVEIQDVEEVRRWLTEGRTATWMSEEYERRYNITARPSLWRHLRGDGRPSGDEPRARSVPIADLMPWTVQPEHQDSPVLRLLLTELRRRAGYPVSPAGLERVERWTAGLAQRDVVIDYDPRTADGFVEVPRRAEDTGLVRRPEPEPPTA